MVWCLFRKASATGDGEIDVPSSMGVQVTNRTSPTPPPEQAPPSSPNSTTTPTINNKENVAPPDSSSSPPSLPKTENEKKKMKRKKEKAARRAKMEELKSSLRSRSLESIAEEGGDLVKASSGITAVSSAEHSDGPTPTTHDEDEQQAGESEADDDFVVLSGDVIIEEQQQQAGIITADTTDDPPGIVHNQGTQEDTTMPEGDDADDDEDEARSHSTPSTNSVYYVSQDETTLRSSVHSDDDLGGSMRNTKILYTQDIFRTSSSDIDGEPPSLRLSKYLSARGYHLPDPIDTSSPPLSVDVNISSSSNSSHDDGSILRATARALIEKRRTVKWRSSTEEEEELDAFSTLNEEDQHLVHLTSSEVSSSTCESSPTAGTKEDSSVRVMKLNPSDVSNSSSSSSDGSRNSGTVALTFKPQQQLTPQLMMMKLSPSEVSSSSGSHDDSSNGTTFFKVEKSETLVGRLPSSWWAMNMDQIQTETADPIQLALFRSESSRREKRRQHLENLEYPDDEI